MSGRRPISRTSRSLTLAVVSTLGLWLAVVWSTPTFAAPHGPSAHPSPSPSPTCPPVAAQHPCKTTTASPSPNDHISEPDDHISESYDHISESYDHISESYDHISESYDHISESYDHISESYDAEPDDHISEPDDHISEPDHEQSLPHTRSHRRPHVANATTWCRR